MTKLDLVPDGIAMGYGRYAHAVLKVAICDVTDMECLCVVIDTSEGEYGEVCISLDYINERSKEL